MIQEAGRPIRTLLFSTLYPSSLRPTNGVFVETRLRELLKSGRVETRVVAPVPWFPSTNERFGRYATMARTPRRETLNGIDVVHPRYFLPPKVGMHVAPLMLALGALPAIRVLRNEGFDFDLIDAHYYYPDGAAAALLSRWLGKPFVITARGTDVNVFPEDPLIRRMVLWTAAHAAASITVAQALADRLVSLGCDRGKIKVLRNGVDLDRFHPMDKVEARRLLGLPEGDAVLLSVGHLLELKGHHIVIKALPGLPGVHLVIAGAGADREALGALADTLGVADRVHFAGSVANQDMYKYYSAADVLTLASSREGWANVLLEAMACGTPAVATPVGGTPEVIGDPVAGCLVAERTPEAFVAAITHLRGRQPARDAVRNYAQAFGWPETTRGQLALFQSAISKGLP